MGGALSYKSEKNLEFVKIHKCQITNPLTVHPQPINWQCEIIHFYIVPLNLNIPFNIRPSGILY